MIVNCWLKVAAERNGYCSDKNSSNYFTARGLKATVNKPGTESNEIAIKLNIEIPNALFLKPSLEFNVSVPDNVRHPSINTEVKDGLAAALSEQLGQKVFLTVDSQPTD